MTKPSKEIAQLRREYTQSELEVDSVLKDPIKQFRKWFDEALNSEMIEPNAMILSTIDEKKAPARQINHCDGWGVCPSCS